MIQIRNQQIITTQVSSNDRSVIPCVCGLQDKSLLFLWPFSLSPGVFFLYPWIDRIEEAEEGNNLIYHFYCAFVHKLDRKSQC